MKMVYGSDGDDVGNCNVGGDDNNKDDKGDGHNL